MNEQRDREIGNVNKLPSTTSIRPRVIAPAWKAPMSWVFQLLTLFPSFLIYDARTLLWIILQAPPGTKLL